MSNNSSKNLQNYAYEYIKNKILSDEFLENEIYSETKISKEIGISRTPMRHALLRLSQEGYIDILPSKGFKLHKFTYKEIIEIFQIRSAIEGFCTVLITTNNKSNDAIKTIEKLKFILEQQKNLILKNGSIAEFADYDALFHSTIVKFANNSEFNNMFDCLMHRIKTLAIDSLSHPNRMNDTLNEHYDILNCIIEGNIENIYKVTLVHMDTPKHINLRCYCE